MKVAVDPQVSDDGTHVVGPLAELDVSEHSAHGGPRLWDHGPRLHDQREGSAIEGLDAPNVPQWPQPRVHQPVDGVDVLHTRGTGNQIATRRSLLNPHPRRGVVKGELREGRDWRHHGTTHGGA